MWFFNLSRSKPERVKKKLLSEVRRLLGPDYDVEKHFTPKYNPWDQRLCLVPDDDLFDAVRTGSASVVTDHIETFTETGIKLKSGEELEADIIVTATGLNILFAAGIDATVDGRKIDFSKTIGYKGVMFSGIPNFAVTFGYTNASWTLKADLSTEYICRVLNHMKATGTDYAVAIPGANITPEIWFDLSSGYVQRGQSMMPKQGNEMPWKIFQNYAKDITLYKRNPVDDGVLQFKRAGGGTAAATHPEAIAAE
jgi:monooxygenase